MKDLFKAVGSMFLALTSVGFIWLGIIAVCTFPFAFWTDRTLEFWLTKIKIMNTGNALISSVDVPFWLSWVVTVVFNGFMLCINIISELVRLCI